MNKLTIEVQRTFTQSLQSEWEVLEVVEFEGAVPPRVEPILKKHGIVGDPYWEDCGDATYDDSELDSVHACRYFITDETGKRYDAGDFFGHMNDDDFDSDDEELWLNLLNDNEE